MDSCLRAIFRKAQEDWRLSVKNTPKNTDLALGTIWGPHAYHTAYNQHVSEQPA
jgi:hypothetical protein